MYRDVPGTCNEQPFHLDGSVPWSTLRNGAIYTALSCVILLGDGPGTVLGRLLSNFWDSFGDDAQGLSDFIRDQIKKSEEEMGPYKSRAGHVVVFPLGSLFFTLLISLGLGFQLHKGVSIVERGTASHLVCRTLTEGVGPSQNEVLEFGIVHHRVDPPVNAQIDQLRLIDLPYPSSDSDSDTPEARSPPQAIVSCRWLWRVMATKGKSLRRRNFLWWYAQVNGSANPQVSPRETFLTHS